jgi:23S rRNA-/tRNA-specific pseudouridylate synthase
MVKHIRIEKRGKIIHIYTILSSCVQCTLYRHEVPVCADDIRIVHMDDDIVVVNKPASIPVSRLF